MTPTHEELKHEARRHWPHESDEFHHNWANYALEKHPGFIQGATSDPVQPMVQQAPQPVAEQRPAVIADAELKGNVAAIRAVLEKPRPAAAPIVVPPMTVTATMPPESLEKRALRIATVAILLLIFLMLVFRPAKGADRAMVGPVPSATPAAISIEDREAIKDLQIAAHEALERQLYAQDAIDKAQLELEHAKRDNDSLNAQIEQKTIELRNKYNAPADKWDISRDFIWAPHKAAPPAKK